MLQHHSRKRALTDPVLPSPPKLRVCPPSASKDRQYSKQNNDGEREEDARHLIADHYSARPNLSVQEREASSIVHLKKLNNWVKSVLIQLYVKEGDTVLDIACGKGGDLNKWDKAKISLYVGIDIAKGSIEDARTRYNGEPDPRRRQKIPSFPARLICADCYGIPLDITLKEDSPFDICSCQFALHYSWLSERRARQALANIAGALKPGGYFIGTIPDANVLVRKLREAEGLEYGNSVYHIRFDDRFRNKIFPASQRFGIEYEFHLEDAVDLPEWLVPFSPFQILAREYGLELIFKMNFHEFVHEYVKQKRFERLMWNMGALGDGTPGGGISADEWDAAYLYMVFVFQKVGQSNPRSNHIRRRPPGPISEEDVIYL